MDPVTQGLLGSTTLFSTKKLDKGHKTLALVCSSLGAMAPDLDILIRSKSDPLLGIAFHRHFTHSLFFIPFGALVVGCLLYFLYRKKYKFKQIYLYSLIGYSTHALLDACTTYGTHLFWPFSNLRVAWGVIGVIDPLYSLLLLFSTYFCFKKRKTLGRVLFGLSFIYLLIGYIQKQRATSVLKQVAKSRSHQAKRLDVKPTLFNNLVWRGIYQFEKHYYIDAVRVGIESKVYTGNKIKVFDTAIMPYHLGLSNTKIKDINRFAHFSDHYLSFHPEDSTVLGDVRYAILPNSIYPLWGIDLDVKSEHVDYVQFRNVNSRTIVQFKGMLLGR